MNKPFTTQDLADTMEDSKTNLTTVLELIERGNISEADFNYIQGMLDAIATIATRLVNYTNQVVDIKRI